MFHVKHIDDNSNYYYVGWSSSNIRHLALYVLTLLSFFPIALIFLHNLFTYYMIVKVIMNINNLVNLMPLIFNLNVILWQTGANLQVYRLVSCGIVIAKAFFMPQRPYLKYYKILPLPKIPVISIAWIKFLDWLTQLVSSMRYHWINPQSVDQLRMSYQTIP